MCELITFPHQNEFGSLKAHSGEDILAHARELFSIAAGMDGNSWDDLHRKIFVLDLAYTGVRIAIERLPKSDKRQRLLSQSAEVQDLARLTWRRLAALEADHSI